jgi:hypothetical protein
MRLAAEQLREVAQGASLGNAPTKVVKLRSSDVYLPIQKINVAAQQLFPAKGHYDLRFHRRLPTHRCSAANRAGITNKLTHPPE